MAQAIETGVSAADRLGFTIFVAIAFHVLLVLTDFLEEDPVPSPFTMEITLSRFDDQKAPEKADFLAKNSISFPCDQHLSKEELDEIIETVQEFYAS